MKQGWHPRTCVKFSDDSFVSLVFQMSFLQATFTHLLVFLVSLPLSFRVSFFDDEKHRHRVRASLCIFSLFLSLPYLDIICVENEVTSKTGTMIMSLEDCYSQFKWLQFLSHPFFHFKLLLLSELMMFSSLSLLLSSLFSSSRVHSVYDWFTWLFHFQTFLSRT